MDGIAGKEMVARRLGGKNMRKLTPSLPLPDRWRKKRR
jgi:hypothetical protein